MKHLSAFEIIILKFNILVPQHVIFFFDLHVKVYLLLMVVMTGLKQVDLFFQILN